ncbi:lysophospholipid acyltransferase family protein [Microterricola viridarii]|uniref:Acyl-phosphate glycerol 3-phosphate acyltransferase n=1 Tax=Microterricola viridarii TaxID=412690 RepID=A0A0Y0MDP4_9MICO|nr:lysophospholipid acyltransferase family protein [Microterricola viridarii]AMB58156.1 acyl-phosphate glycerol 3-phosphate acyltransferase [Microterricola viridarii]
MPQTTARGRRPRSEKSQPSIFWVFAGIAVPLMNLAARFEIRDGHKMPRQGAYVVAPNHYSEIDPVVVGVVAWKLGRYPRFLAKASVFKVPVLGWALRASGQIPVERAGNNSHSALRAAEELVEKGRMVVVYPEGSLTRDPDLWPMRGKTGAVRIALERDIPVIPVAHWGSQQLMARYSKKISVFPRKHILVKVGDPVDLDAFRGKPLDTANLNAATAVVMDAITMLLEDLRGEKAPAERWNPSAHDQKETGRFDS